MARRYEHIQQYANKINKLKEQGLTHQEIADRLGLTKKQVSKFIERQHKKERQITAEKVPLRKSKPRKKEFTLPPSIENQDELSQMRYIMKKKTNISSVWRWKTNL